MSVDDDKDVLAAEYALGTLDAVDRANVHMLMAIDPEFVLSVRRWERRLGVLDALVAPVEPPKTTWAAIKAQIGKQQPGGQIWLPDADDAASSESVAARPAIAFAPEPQSPVDRTTIATEDLAASAEPSPQPASTPFRGPIAEPVEPTAMPVPGEVVELAGRLRAWRQLAIAATAMAAVLVAFFLVREVRPDLMPSGLRPRPVEIVRTIEMPSQKMAEFVAVFQKDDASPAFLLTVDVEHRALSVRKVGAQPQTGKSYELWIVPAGATAPRSLGLVGDQEFTVRRALNDYDQITLTNATFAVSLEPAGGSPTGKPTGPALHGKLLQATPPAFPAATP